jgi:hypothetical protein
VAEVPGPTSLLKVIGEAGRKAAIEVLDRKAALEAKVPEAEANVVKAGVQASAVDGRSTVPSTSNLKNLSPTVCISTIRRTSS